MATMFRSTTSREADTTDAEKLVYDPLIRSDSQDGFESDRDFESTLPLHATIRHQRRRHRCFPLLAKGLAIGIGILSLLALGRISAPHTPGLDRWVAPRQACWCGTNTAEAAALGCKFDQIAAAWLPPHCRDDELEEDFAHAGPNPDGSWNYYDEPDMKWRLNLTEVGSRADTNLAFFSSLDWHIAHCAYNWMKQFRAKERGTVIEAEVNTEGHIRHCFSIFRMRGPLDGLATIAGVHINGDHAPEKSSFKEEHFKDLKIVPSVGGPHNAHTRPG
jgi:hypothetical protein